MIYTAFTIGLFGSLHCVGMCGPIALALPGSESKWDSARRLLLYNGGRIITYMLMGAVIGLFGEAFNLADIQKWLSILAGVFLLVVALFSIPVESHLLNWPALGRAYLFLKGSLFRNLTKGSSLSFLKTGLLNGLLPCGLVYVALVGALTSGGFVSSLLYMFLFGVGTVPLMMATVLLGKRVDIKFRNYIKKFYPALLFALAGLFLYRGIQFSVPQDFSFWEMMQDMPMCH